MEPGYWSAKHTLEAMTRRMEVIRGREVPLLLSRRPPSGNYSQPTLFHRPGAIIRRDETTTYGHDMAVVVSYVLLQSLGRLRSFRRFFTAEQHDYYAKGWNLLPDATFSLMQNPTHAFFLEIDSGTEWTKSQIEEKCRAYVEFANAHPDDRFTVLFPTKGYDGQTDEARMGKLLETFAKFRRQNMFLTTSWADFVGDLKRMDGTPLAHVFRSPWRASDNPLDPDRISILDVT